VKTEKRLGSIEIDGIAYPLNYSIRNAAEVDNALSATNPEEYGKYGVVAKNIRILGLLLRDGAEYMNHFHGEKISPPAEEDLLYLLSPNDNPRVFSAIKETVESGGARLVEVAEKNAQAAPAKKERA